MVGVWRWVLRGLSGNICVVEIMVEEERTCSMAAFFKVSWQTISSLKVSTIEICYQFISSVCIVFLIFLGA